MVDVFSFSPRRDPCTPVDEQEGKYQIAGCIVFFAVRMKAEQVLTFSRSFLITVWTTPRPFLLKSTREGHLLPPKTVCY